MIVIEDTEPPATNQSALDGPVITALKGQIEQLQGQLQDHRCSVCQDVLDEPVNLPCGLHTSHAVCKADLLKLKKSYVRCPLCNCSLRPWIDNITIDNLGDFVNQMRQRFVVEKKTREFFYLTLNTFTLHAKILTNVLSNLEIKITQLRLERAQITAEIDKLENELRRTREEREAARI